MQPRPQQGTSLLVAMQMMVTDEDLFMARVAMKDPSDGGRVKVCHDQLPLWQDLNVREDFASTVAAHVWDGVAWTVS